MKAVLLDYLHRRGTQTCKEEVLRLAAELRLKISPAEAAKIAGRINGSARKV